MAEFQDSIEIEAPPQAVFEYLTTNEGMTAWMGAVRRSDPTTGRPVRGRHRRLPRTG